MTTPKEGTTDPKLEIKGFTQEDVNSMMGKVRSEERAKYLDYDKLKERAAVADKLEKANLTKEERTTQEAATWQRKAIDSEARIADMAIRADIRVQAALQGIIDPDAAVALIDRSGIVYSEEEGVKGVAEALTALVTAKPYLKGVAGKPAAPNLNAKDGKPVGATPQLSAEQRNVAHRLYPELSHTDAEVKYNKGMPAKA